MKASKKEKVIIKKLQSYEITKSGFTLIELLVVVAIIGLLSSIVLASLSDSRTKAQNTKKNQMVIQYVNALELYRDDNPDEGYPHEGTINIDYCIGPYSASERCIDNVTYNSSISSKFDTTITGPPNDTTPVPYTPPVPYPTRDYKGTSYRCLFLSNGICTSYTMSWYLLGTNQNCNQGSWAANLGENSICELKK